MLLASTAGLRRCRPGAHAFRTDGQLSLCFRATEYRRFPWDVLSREFLEKFVRSGYALENSVQVPASRLNAVRHDGSHALGMRKGAHCDNGHPTHGLDSVLRCADADVLLGPAERLAKVLRQTPSSITGHQPPLALRQQGRYVLCSPLGCQSSYRDGARWDRFFS